MGAIQRLHRAQMGVSGGGKYIKFADPEVLRVLLANGVSSDGVGITLEDAARVTSIDRWFNGNTEITSFDEFEKFSNVTTLVGGSSTVGGAFWKCSALSSIKLPESLTTIGIRSFEGCTSLSIKYIPVGVTSINDHAFGSIMSAQEDFILPNLTSLGLAAFIGVGGIRRVLDLGVITSLNGGGSIATNSSTFRSCPDIELFIIPSTVTTMGKGAISILPKLTNIVSKPATPPTYTDNSLYQLPALVAIYVPDGSVEAYKTATGWVRWSSYIKGISSLQTDDATLYNEIKDYL